jgi:hypothetical protein
MPGVHAKLSASGASRWMACPPSVELEAEIRSKHKNEETSVYAEEGTAAHELAEAKLRLYLEPKSRKLKAELKKARASSWYNEEMEEATTRYVDKVIELYHDALKSSDDALLLVEQRLDFSPWVPEGFGTGDAVIIGDGRLRVCDLKYGKGVPVSAEGNPQARLYGLGAYYTYEAVYDIDGVETWIIQPRLDAVSSELISASDLLQWATDEVVPKAQLAAEGAGEFTPGSHCRWCAAKATCRARTEANLMMASYEFAPPATLDTDEIAVVLSKAEELQAWAKDLQAYALEQAEKHGVKFAGWKLVEGRSVRTIEDEAAVIGALRDEGFTDDDIYTRKLAGLTAYGKLLGKKTLETLLGPYIIKPPGKPTLVPEADKRPEISSAASAAVDFEEA